MWVTYKKNCFFLIPRMPAYTFEEMKSSTKSANRLLEVGPYPLLISLQARGVMWKRRLWDKEGKQSWKPDPVLRGAKPGWGVKPGEQLLRKLNFPSELCRMSVGSHSSASDNHTSQKEFGGRILCFLNFVCVCIQERKEWRKTGFQSSNSDPVGSLLPAGLLKGSGHQYFLIAPRPKTLTQTLANRTQNIFWIYVKQGERHFRQNIQTER